MARTKQTARKSTGGKEPQQQQQQQQQQNNDGDDYDNDDVPPPPPLAKPIHNQQLIEQGWKPSGKLGIPTADELIQGRGNLKKTKQRYNAVKVGIEIFNSKFFTDVKDWYYDYMPLVHSKNALYSALGSGDLTTIDLSGVDQLTDLFFKQIIEFNLKFPSLDKLNISGCIYITDLGVKWICTIFTTAKEIIMQGCRKLTEQSLYTLLKTGDRSAVRTLDMKGTSVAVIPIKLNREIRASVKLDGCPLISPTIEKHVKYSNGYYDIEKCVPLRNWKVVIINPDLETYSLGSYLVDGDITSSDGVQQPHKFMEDVQFHHVNLLLGEDARFNVYEMKTLEAKTDMLISEGCICVLAYNLASDFEDVIHKITGDILAVYSKCINCVVVVCGIIPQGVESEQQKQLESSFKSDTSLELKNAILFHADHLLANYSEIVRMPWMEACLDFPNQQYLGRMLEHSEGLQEVLKLDKMVFSVIKMKVSEGAAVSESSTELQKCIKGWTDASARCVPWQETFGSDFVTMHNIMKQKEKSKESSKSLYSDKYQNEEVKVNTVENYHKLYSRDVAWDLNISKPAVCKGLEILANMGLFQLVPMKNRDPIVLNMEVMQRLFTVLENAPFKTGLHIKSDKNLPEEEHHLDVHCIGNDYPCWTEHSLLAKIPQVLNPEDKKHVVFHIDRHTHIEILRFLEKENVLLKLPTNRSRQPGNESKGTTYEDNFVYIMHKNLPKQPVYDLELFWPRKRPEHSVQLERAYYFLHGMPKSFMTAIFRHLGKVFPFTMIWQSGAYIQLGANDIVLHRSTIGTNEDISVIVIAVRGIKPTKVNQTDIRLESEQEQELENGEENLLKCLWSCLKLTTSIMDYVLQKMNVFAEVMVMCKDCSPDQDIYSMTLHDKINSLPLSTALNGIPRKKLHCRKSCEKRAKADGLDKPPSFKKEDFHSPDGTENDTLAPRHNHMFLQKVLESDSFLNYSRCFMCQNCAEFGTRCPKNSFNGKTSRDCGCGTKVILCPACGICTRCTAFIAKVETSLMPGLSSAEPFQFMDKFSKDDNNQNTMIGNKVNCNTEAVLIARQAMTPEHFNNFEITILRGNFIILGLGKAITYDDIQDPMKCFVMSYDLQKGLIDVPSRTSQKHSKFEGREGHTVGFHMRYCEYGSGIPCNEDMAMIVVDVVQNGKRLTSMYFDKSEIDALFPVIHVINPTLFLINSPGIWSKRKEMKKMSTFHEGQIVEYTSNTLQNSCLLAKITKVSKFDGKSLVVINNVMNDAGSVALYTGDADSLYIHPVGFHKTKGYTLVLRTPHYKGTTKEVATVTNERYNLGDPELEKVLEKHVLADWQCFTELQTGGIVPHPSQCYYRIEAECTRAAQLTMYPGELYCKMAQFRKELQKYLFKQGEISLTEGAAVALLPRKMPEVNETMLDHFVTPNAVKSSDLKLHALCHIRASASEMQYLPSGYEVGEEAEPHWMAHFLNSPGINISPEERHQCERLIMAWHTYMALESNVIVPNDWSQMFENQVADTYVCPWLHKYMMISAQIYFSGLPEESANPAMDINVSMDQVYKLNKIVQSNTEELGLKKVKRTQFLDDNEQSFLLLCPAHGESTLQDRKHLENPTFPMERFNNYAKFIASLEVTECMLQQLPDDIFNEFNNLVLLDLSNNLLRSVPIGLGNCKKLVYLNLRMNLLEDLPIELKMLKNCLKRLDIGYNPMKSLPYVVTKLTQLAKLYIEELFLEEIPKSIGKLTKLEILAMNENCIRRLPSTMMYLKKLNQLLINGVPWLEDTGRPLVSYGAFKQRHYQQWFKEHNVDTRELFTGSNWEDYVEQDAVTEVNTKLYSTFGRFGKEIRDGSLQEYVFPNVILTLENLEYLSIQFQSITHIPKEIAHLKKLKSLILSHCPFLTSLPAELGNLQLKRLVIDECPALNTPPKEIQARGQAAVMAYIRRLQTGSVKCSRTKLMMVGLGGAGKTSLVKAMMNPDGKAHLESGADITDGIDINNWTVEEDGGAVTFSVWDFAGQTVYYNTHQFFLSNRAVYMLLWNMRLGFEHAGLDFWLSSIRVHAPNAPVFVVGTHSDKVSQWTLPMASIKERYPAIEEFFFVSSFTGEKVLELKSHLYKWASVQPYMGESIPQVWLNFESAIVKLREKESVVAYTDIEKVATETGIFEKSEVGEAVQFLHELGTLQHFNNEYLKDKVVVDPQWIVDVMACVVSVKDSTIEAGKFYHRDMDKVWKDYPESVHNWLLRLTEEYDLTFPLHDHPINLVPCLLPDHIDDLEWPEVDASSGIRETKMIYRFDYLPAGLFNRAQVRLYQYSDSSKIWKNGSVLQKNGNLALVTHSPSKRDSELLIKVQGPRPENIMFVIHEVFEGLIAESFHGVKYDYLLPCPDCLKVNMNDAYMFSALTINRATELKAPFMQCTKHFHVITLTDLHSIMPPDNNKDYDVQLATAVRGLSDLKKDLRLDIFISFCNEDLAENQKTQVVCPRQIRRDLTDKGFKCYFPEPSTSTHIEQQALAMRDCKAFMALVSDSYVLDPQCANMFHYARLTLNKPLIMVVLGQGKNWRKSKVGILVSDEVYINMTQIERYSFKLDELQNVATDRITEKMEDKQYPPCFISYNWSNSQQAIAKGSRKIEGAIGYGDPRELKEYLQKNGIDCWIDIERVGRVGLFEDIADGLQNSRVVLACVSDQYAESQNCAMEFRFATSVLKLPTILAVVGTTNNWRKSEVGMLSLQGPLPEVNFQDKSDSVHEKLLQNIKAHLPKDILEVNKPREPIKKAETLNEDQKNTSFQELYELAQRKFLRQISQYADEVVYPRLIVVDFLEMIKDQIEKDASRSSSAQATRPGVKKRITGALLSQNELGFKILCEHEEGWHNFAGPIHAPPEFDESYVSRFSPYLARITALLRHSNQLYLNCLGGDAGNSFLKWLEELPQATLSDFGTIYSEFRNEVIKADTDMTMGQLSRCHLPSGKTIWLCPEHQKVTRMTLLTNDVILPREGNTLTTKDVGLHYELLGLVYEGKLNLYTIEEFDDGNMSPDEEEEEDKPLVTAVEKQNRFLSSEFNDQEAVVYDEGIVVYAKRIPNNLMEVENQQVQQQQESSGSFEIEEEFTLPSEHVKCVDFYNVPDKHPWILTGMFSGKVLVWDYDTQQVVKTFNVSTFPLRVAIFFSRKDWIITGSDDNFLRVFGIHTEYKVHEFQPHDDAIRSIAMHPERPYAITCSDDNFIKVYHWKNDWQFVRKFEGHTDSVMKVVINPKENSTCASASLDGTIKTWEIFRTGSNSSGLTFKADEPVFCIDYYPRDDQQLLVSAGQGNVVRVWDYETGTCIQMLEGHTNSVSSVMFHPDLPLIISGSLHRQLRVWNSATYKLEFKKTYNVKRIWALGCLKGSDKFAIACDEGCVIYKVSVKEQEEWKIPQSRSNLKNPKGYTIPLDERANGRADKKLKSLVLEEEEEEEEEEVMGNSDIIKKKVSVEEEEEEEAGESPDYLGGANQSVPLPVGFSLALQNQQGSFNFSKPPQPPAVPKDGFNNSNQSNPSGLFNSSNNQDNAGNTPGRAIFGSRRPDSFTEPQEVAFSSTHLNQQGNLNFSKPELPSATTQNGLGDANQSAPLPVGYSLTRRNQQGNVNFSKPPQPPQQSQDSFTDTPQHVAFSSTHLNQQGNFNFSKPDLPSATPKNGLGDASQSSPLPGGFSLALANQQGSFNFPKPPQPPAVPKDGFNNSNQSNPSGLFNSNNNQDNAGSLFGSSRNQSNTPGRAIFGSSHSPMRSSGLGANTSTNNANGLFDTRNDQNSSDSRFSFGMNNKATDIPIDKTKYQRPSASSLFGTAATQSTTQSNTILFGTSANQSSYFGTINHQSQTAALFGTNASQNNTGGLLHTSASQTNTGSLFGTNASQDNTGSLFGTNVSQANTGSLFGTSANQSNTGGIFNTSANQSTTGGLFGTNANQSNTGGLVNTSANQSTTGGLFGTNANQSNTGGLFSTNANQSNTGGLFSTNSNQSNTNFSSGDFVPIEQGRLFGGVGTFGNQSLRAAATNGKPPRPTSRKQSAVRERSKANLEREKTKSQLHAVSSAALKAAQAQEPQSELCTIL